MSYTILLYVQKIRECSQELLPIISKKENMFEIKQKVNTINNLVNQIIELSNIQTISELSTSFSRHHYWLNRRVNEGNPRLAESDLVDFLNWDINDLRIKLISLFGIEEKNDLIGIEQIDSGGFAKVLKGLSAIRGEIVACKELYSPMVMREMYGDDGEEFSERFRREVRLMKEFNHPNILPIYETQLDNRPYWFTMPLADCSLSKWVMENALVSEEVRLEIFLKILTGVKYLHEQDKYHRDLAPSNILLLDSKTECPSVYIADFGLAKDMQSTSFKTGHSVKGYGHQDFTAPEQYASLSNASHLSDIYSLGGLLFFILSGESPNMRFTKSVKLQRIVERAMKQEPEERYQSVQDFILAIQDVKKNIQKQSFLTSFESIVDFTYSGSDSLDADNIFDFLLLAKEVSIESVYERFIIPLLSIREDIFLLCCSDHEESMSYFVDILSKNLANLSKATKYPFTVWNVLDTLLGQMYHSFNSDTLRIKIINQILQHALQYDRYKAQALVPTIISKINTGSNLANNIANLIQDEFSHRLEKLKFLLKNTQYPKEIRFVLDDF